MNADRSRWQFGIASLIALQALTCIAMSIFTTLSLMTIVAVSLFVFPLGLILLGTVLVARNMQEVGQLFSRCGWRGFVYIALPIGMFFLIVLLTRLFFW